MKGKLNSESEPQLKLNLIIIIFLIKQIICNKYIKRPICHILAVGWDCLMHCISTIKSGDDWKKFHVPSKKDWILKNKQAWDTRESHEPYWLLATTLSTYHTFYAFLIFIAAFQDYAMLFTWSWITEASRSEMICLQHTSCTWQSPGWSTVLSCSNYYKSSPNITVQEKRMLRWKEGAREGVHGVMG